MEHIYELRTYQAVEGRIEEVLARFRDHTLQLFTEHGIKSIGYWISEEDPNKLIYLVQHDGDPEANWDAFRADERWIRVRDESHKNGVLTESIRAERLNATDFSALK